MMDLKIVSTQLLDLRREIACQEALVKYEKQPEIFRERQFYIMALENKLNLILYKLQQYRIKESNRRA